MRDTNTSATRVKADKYRRSRWDLRVHGTEENEEVMENFVEVIC